MANQPTSAAKVACNECGADDAIQIEVTLPDSTEVTFYSCHRCEHRWWARGQRDLGVDAVLKLVKKKK